MHNRNANDYPRNEEEVSIIVTSEIDDGDDDGDEESPQHATERDLKDVGRSIVLRLKQGDAMQHVKYEEDVVSDRIEVARGGVTRLLPFDKVFPPRVTIRSIYNKAVRHIVCRALSPSLTEHSTILLYGSKESSKSDTMTGTSYDNGLLALIAMDLLSSGCRVTVTAIILKGDQAVINLLTGSRSVIDVPVTHRVLDTIKGQLSKIGSSSTVLITLSVHKSNGCSKISLVSFADAEELTPCTRKHPITAGEIIRSFSSKRSGNSLKLTSRKSKLTHILYTSIPPALTFDSQVVFISVSSTTLSDTAENVLRFTSDLCIHPQKSSEVETSTGRDYSVSSSPPKPTEAPRRWEESQLDAAANATDKKDTARLEEELLITKTQLFDSRNHLDTIETENNELRATVASNQHQTGELLKQFEHTNKELVCLKEVRRSFQLKVAEGEQLLQQKDQKIEQLLSENKDLTAALMALTSEKESLANENAALQESLASNSREPQERETLLTTVPNPTTTEVGILRKSVEKAQHHIRDLAEQLLSRSAEPEATAKLLEHLDLSRELNKINSASADACEKRLEAILQGGEQACDSDRMFLLETRLEKATRLLRKSELEFQQHKLDSQEREKAKEIKLKQVTEKINQLTSENALLSQQADDNNTERTTVEEELQHLRQENASLLTKNQVVSSEVANLQNHATELQQELETQAARMRNTEVQALDELSSQLAQHSISNSLMEKENVALRERLQTVTDQLTLLDKETQQKIHLMEQEKEQLRLQKAQEIESLQQKLSSGQLLQDFFKKNDAQRFEENLNSELQLNSQNKELKIQLQVQSAIISALEKKLADALSSQ
eukprot:TRINITY_DN19192_c0_g1_i1.p1 TRINITY_DN19192_c0_g1~~TRINITY_DN19192_c0_g1_i1.p1  ORF type:complete len:841 (+),score=188.09 TRINITY_DN19192_c0_g1_i1:138-2660(+)